jgi:dTDP-4-amino-4,6-dideoxygalactose transaminase
MQCGEGGVVICDQDFFAHKLKMVRNHGEVVFAERLINEYQDGDEKVIGYNYRLTELQAAIALPHLRRLDELNRARIKLANYLSQRLVEFKFIKQPVIRNSCSHVYYLYPMLFDSKTAGMTRDQFVDQMQKEGAPVSNYIRPLYRLPVYSARHDKPEIYSSKNFPITESLWKEKMLVTSICRPPLGLEHIDLFIDAIRKVVGKVI